jgi:hypothetical protein
MSAEIALLAAIWLTLASASGRIPSTAQTVAFWLGVVFGALAVWTLIAPIVERIKVS